MNNYPFNEDEDFETNSNVSFKERFGAYKISCREMLKSSASHLLKPVTIIVIILLIATYILLGVAGTVGLLVAVEGSDIGLPSSSVNTSSRSRLIVVSGE